MKIQKIIIACSIIICSALALPFQHSAFSAEKINFAVIFLGGPDTGPEGDKIITQFVDSLGKLTGMRKNAMGGKYFNNVSDAKTYIQQNKNSYIMGSIAFYLSNRKAMKLSPLAMVKINGSSEEQYFVIVKKGKYKSLDQMKDKVLAGNILYEDKKFINKMIFNDSIDISKHFKLKPTNRPLTAVRKLIRGEFDAVLVNHLQYASLKNLSEFGSLQILHQSPKMPALGLMMIDTPANKAAKGKIVKAVTRMCGQADTKETCKNFGIEGFDPVEIKELENEITKYEKN